MRFFNRNNDSAAAIPEDLQPYYTPQETGWRRWVAPVLRGILLLVLLGLLVWGGVWLVNRLTGDDPAPSSQNTAQNAQNAANDAKAKTDAADVEAKRKADEAKAKTDAAAAETKRKADEAKKKADERARIAANNPTPAPNPATPSPTPRPTPPSPTPAPTPTQNVPAPASPTTTPAQLPNSGPGEIAAIFLAVTTAGTLLYRSFLARTLGASGSRR